MIEFHQLHHRQAALGPLLYQTAYATRIERLTYPTDSQQRQHQFLQKGKQLIVLFKEETISTRPMLVGNP